SILYKYNGKGRTWRIETQQHPNHPGNSLPSFSIEACGSPANNSSWGIINLFPMDNQDADEDIFCGVTTAAFDPNIKVGYPVGLTNDHKVSPNLNMRYIINFQNTGNDTAFTVILRDTLDSALDITSVKSGVSSHAYTFEINGPRVLTWIF